MTRLLLTLSNKAVAYKAYMPFIKEGAIFVPTSTSFELGDEIEVVITLKELNKSISIAGPVIWVTPPVSRTREGVGVQFTGANGAEARKHIETYLTGFSKKTQLDTYTL